MARSLNNKWKLLQQSARIDLGLNSLTQLEVDLTNPQHGATLGDSNIREHKLFGIAGLETASDEPLDPYARGSDLIVRYPFSDLRKIGAELYWRVGEHLSSPDDESDDYDDEDESDGVDGIQTLELIYSLETGELDAKPDPEVVSVLAGSLVDSFHLASDGEPNKDKNKNACLIKCEQFQVFLMSLPSDLANVKISAGESCEVRFELKSSFLEKGVIRRARLLMVVGELEHAPEVFLKVANNFLGSELPLTT